MDPDPVTMFNTPGGRSAALTMAPSSIAVIDVTSAGLRIIVPPAARAGATNLPACHQQRKIPGNDSNSHADRLPHSLGNETGVGERDRLFRIAVEFFGEVGVEIETSSGVGDVPFRFGDGFAVVDG